tara:strand:+ start:15443 stop:15883 length:441 start_codon:yes stop_codon:yes gene_type:complete
MSIISSIIILSTILITSAYIPNWNNRNIHNLENTGYLRNHHEMTQHTPIMNIEESNHFFSKKFSSEMYRLGVGSGWENLRSLDDDIVVNKKKDTKKFSSEMYRLGVGSGWGNFRSLDDDIEVNKKKECKRCFGSKINITRCLGREF